MMLLQWWHWLCIAVGLLLFLLLVALFTYICYKKHQNNVEKLDPTLAAENGEIKTSESVERVISRPGDVAGLPDFSRQTGNGQRNLALPIQNSNRESATVSAIHDIAAQRIPAQPFSVSLSVEKQSNSASYHDAFITEQLPYFPGTNDSYRTNNVSMPTTPTFIVRSSSQQQQQSQVALATPAHPQDSSVQRLNGFASSFQRKILPSEPRVVFQRGNQDRPSAASTATIRSSETLFDFFLSYIFGMDLRYYGSMLHNVRATNGYILAADACKDGIGAALVHYSPLMCKEILWCHGAFPKHIRFHTDETNDNPRGNVARESLAVAIALRYFCETGRLIPNSNGRKTFILILTDNKEARWRLNEIDFRAIPFRSLLESVMGYINEGFDYSAEWLPGRNNWLADKLSRSNIDAAEREFQRKFLYRGLPLRLKVRELFLNKRYFDCN